ncbi:MAG: hypothetical protein F6J90_39485 [Moorea sp. SIOASIH]|uniref:hypothetical protein n=1 Tax=Moorena sp. SIOASIH TaxID=2607817 RepID=UPI0013B8D4F2|nr:hypothetical protein [Moorena sp. SIOASIH]NEO42081.1 hypothetical protein [Moorena sp. SIOASIH]
MRSRSGSIRVAWPKGQGASHFLSLFPIPYSLLPAPCSLLPKTQDFLPHPIDNYYS